MGLDNKGLAAVERWTLILAGIAIAAASVLASRRFAFGVAVGAALMCLNAWALRRIGARILRAAASSPGLAVLLFNLKMLALMVVVYLALKFLPVDGIGFIVGVSVFPAAIVAAALKTSLNAADADGNGAPHGDRS